MSESPNRFSGMSARELAEFNTQLWGHALGMSGDRLQEYITAAGDSADQFEDFDITMLSGKDLNELIENGETLVQLRNVILYLLFSSGVIAAFPTFVEFLEFNKELIKASVLWSYLRGHRDGVANATSADAFNDFVSDLDFDE